MKKYCRYGGRAGFIGSALGEVSFAARSGDGEIHVIRQPCGPEANRFSKRIWLEDRAASPIYETTRGDFADRPRRQARADTAVFHSRRHSIGFVLAAVIHEPVPSMKISGTSTGTFPVIDGAAGGGWFGGPAWVLMPHPLRAYGDFTEVLRRWRQWPPRPSRPMRRKRKEGMMGRILCRRVQRVLGMDTGFDATFFKVYGTSGQDPSEPYSGVISTLHDRAARSGRGADFFFSIFRRRGGASRASSLMSRDVVAL